MASRRSRSMEEATTLADEPSSDTPLLSQEHVEEGTANEDESSNDHHRRPVLRFVRRIASLMVSPVSGEEAPGSTILGLLTLFVIGSVLGAVLPKNTLLPTPWYRTVSACIGYTYFICWAISFYPQAIQNRKRQTTRGLSSDFCFLNVIGFLCYSAYNCALFYSPEIQREYKERHAGAEITVQSNDVAFSVHALLLASITLFQIGYYDGILSRRPSRVIEGVILVFLLTILGAGILVSMDKLSWLDFLYVLSDIKIAVTLIKYVPQMILNYKRKSTTGWSIWQILLDFSGGALSDLQLVLDCVAFKDFSGITANFPKLVLGLTSIVFDTIFMLQHYVWYRDNNTDLAGGDDTEPNLSEDTALL